MELRKRLVKTTALVPVCIFFTVPLFIQHNLLIRPYFVIYSTSSGFGADLKLALRFMVSEMDTLLLCIDKLYSFLII